MDELYLRVREGEIKELNLIIKADVQGSVEALQQALEKLSTAEVKVNVIHSGVGLLPNRHYVGRCLQGSCDRFQRAPRRKATQAAETEA